MTAATFVSDKQFKSVVKENPNTPIVGVHKGFPCQVKIVDEKRRLIDFTISTESVDRMWDKIYIKGWELENYLQNPVVLFGHDHYSPPIAKTVSLTKHPTKKTLEARAEFATRDVYPFADMIFNLYLQGFMKATSVGFRPLEYKFCDDDDERKSHYGIDFIRQELLEYSAVSVPANPEALIDAKSKGIDLSPLKSWASETLDTYDEHSKNGLIIPKKTLEQMYKHSGTFGKRLSLNTQRIKDLAKENLAKIKEQEALLEGSINMTSIKEDDVLDLENKDSLVIESPEIVESGVIEDQTENLESKKLDDVSEGLPNVVDEPNDVVSNEESLEPSKKDSKELPVEMEPKIDDVEELTLEEVLIYLKTDSSIENMLDFLVEVNKNPDVVVDAKYVRAVNYLRNLTLELVKETDRVLNTFDNAEKQLVAPEVIKQVDKNTTLCQDDQEFDLDNFVTELEKEEVNDYSNLDDFDLDEDFIKEVLQDVIKSVVDVEIKRAIKELSGKLD